MSHNIEMSISRTEAKKAASLLEMSKATNVGLRSLSVPELELDLARVSDKIGRSRSVLLLDDAAHAFSPDQQRDFFDFYRQIKSQTISPKTAVYPGVTNYSSSFHVGHDAEQIDVWIKPDRDEYLGFMRNLVATRFPDFLDASSNSEAIDLLCFASFGIPRALLNMLQELSTQRDDAEVDISLNRVDVLRSIKVHFASTKKLFMSLSAKLPVYRSFIATGDTIFTNAVALIKAYNKGKQPERQSVAIALSSEDISPEIAKVFAFFQYAGLCIPKEDLVSRGEKGRFQIYTLHYAALVDSNALIGAKSVNFSDYIVGFSKRNAHEFTRTKAPALIGPYEPDKAFVLSLPPCRSCETPRPFEDAKFCVACGSPLTSPSMYLSLINGPIDNLPLTKSRIRNIKEQSKIRLIKDIILDVEHKELLAVTRIGKYWAARIVALAEEFVE